jgi:hypothetical protein
MGMIIRRIYLFLGSAAFAIILIATATIFVIAGTIVESKTESHQAAAHFTYNHPIFYLLLAGFFLNILISALLRWPFKPHHVPFLITHLGLLMIISGIFVKNWKGVQGTMHIVEGTASQELLLPESYGIYLTAENGSKLVWKFESGKLFPMNRSNVDLELVEYWPHGKSLLEAWVKNGSTAWLSHLLYFPLEEWHGEDLPNPHVIYLEGLRDKWEVWTLKTDHPLLAAKQVYLRHLNIQLKDSQNENILVEGDGESLLDAPILWHGGQATLSLLFEDVPEFQLDLTYHHSKAKELVRIPLTGDFSLFNQSGQALYKGRAPLTLDIAKKPALLLAYSSNGDVAFFIFGSNGEIVRQKYPNNEISSYLAYDHGYKGYGVPARFNLDISTRFQKEKAFMEEFKHVLATASPAALSPPFAMLHAAAGNAFPEIAASFLKDWDLSGGWFFPAEINTYEESLKKLSWNSSERTGCAWACKIIGMLEEEMKSGKTLSEILAMKKWPFLKQLNTEDQPAEILSTLTRQIILLGDSLPSLPNSYSQAQLLSAYFRAYGIHLQNLFHPIASKKKEIALECPLTMHLEKEIPPAKWEERCPVVSLLLKKDGKKFRLRIPFDRAGKGLKWPTANGEYLASFQPLMHKIPYRVRLRNARTVSYPGTQQPCSYECDVLVTDSSGNTTEMTLSMNQVYETRDGYRFYLSGMAPSDESAVKNVQIVVNYDPAKNFLTYPGGFILSLGIVLLFWNKKNKTLLS